MSAAHRDLLVLGARSGRVGSEQFPNDSATEDAVVDVAETLDREHLLDEVT